MISTLLSIMLVGQAAPTLDLKLVPTGAMPQIGFYYPQRLQLGDFAPSTWKNVPDHAIGFGDLEFGGKLLRLVETGTPTTFEKIYVDTTGAEDFANAVSFDWVGTPQNPKLPDGPKLYRTELKLPSPIAHGQPVGVSMYRFDPTDKQRAQFKSTLLYYCDYALAGKITLGGKEYRALLLDTLTRGTFDPPAATKEKGPAASQILIDRNGDGRFTAPFEMFDASKPFNIDGTTFELTGLYGGASHVGVGQSAITVAEIPVPPSFGAGKKMLAFTATDTNGKTVHFPQDFRGKVVMVDFWATWCGPCMGEVPNVVSVYNQLHPKGFEILGISLDNAETIKQIGPVTKEKGMTWDQVADGKYWDATIAKLYGIRAIPAAFIVDGDTGMIYAEGENIRGEKLMPAVQKALGSKTQAPK